MNHPGPSWGHLGATLGPSWAILGPCWAILGPSLAILGFLGAKMHSTARSGLSWGHLGAILGPSWAQLRLIFNLDSAYSGSFTILMPQPLFFRKPGRGTEERRPSLLEKWCSIAFRLALVHKNGGEEREEQ